MKILNKQPNLSQEKKEKKILSIYLIKKTFQHTITSTVMETRK